MIENFDKKKENEEKDDLNYIKPITVNSEGNENTNSSTIDSPNEPVDEAPIADEIIPTKEVTTDKSVKTTTTTPSLTPSKQFIYSSYSPVKYLTIIISPGIEFVPKMINKTSTKNSVLFNPLVEYSKTQINSLPNDQLMRDSKGNIVKRDPKDKTEIFNKFFQEDAFNLMLQESTRSLFSQRSVGQLISENIPSFVSDPNAKNKRTLRINKTIEQATSEGVVDKNIIATLDTLFATNNVLYINGQPYTVYSYSWNKEWQIDTKLPKSFEYGMSPYGADNYYRYKTDQMKIADEELSKIPKDAQMSKAMQNRLKKQEGTDIVTTTTLKTTTTTYELRIGANLGNATNLKGLPNLEYLSLFQLNYGCRKSITPARDNVLDPISFSLILTDEFLSKHKEFKASYDNSTKKNNDFASAYNKFYVSFNEILKAKQELNAAYNKLKIQIAELPPPIQKAGENPKITPEPEPEPEPIKEDPATTKSTSTTPLFYALSELNINDLSRFNKVYNIDKAKDNVMLNLIKKLIKTSKDAVEIFNVPVLDNEMVLQEEKNLTDDKNKRKQLDQKMAQLFDADMKKINIVKEFNQQLEKIKSIEKGEDIITELNKIQNNYNGIVNEEFEIYSDIKRFTNFLKRHTTDKNSLKLWKNIFVKKINIIKDCIRAFSISINKSIVEYKNLIESQILCFKTFNNTLLMMKKFFNKPDDEPYRIIVNNDIELYKSFIENISAITDENFTRHLDILLISINEEHDLLNSAELATLYFNSPSSIDADMSSFDNFINEYVRIFMQSNNFILREMQNVSNNTYSQFISIVRTNMENYSSPILPSDAADAISRVPIAVGSVSTMELVQSNASEKIQTDTYKLIHMIIALSEIMCSRTINNLSQINYFNEIALSNANIEIEVFNKFIHSMSGSSSDSDVVQCINPKYFKIKKSDLNKLLKMFIDAKADILDKEVKNYSKFIFFKKQCSELFKKLLPTRNEPVKNMCDLIVEGDEIKFEFMSVELYMLSKSYIQDTDTQYVFQKKLMDFMTSKKSEYNFNDPNYVKFWKLYKSEKPIIKGLNDLTKILLIVADILNGQLYLENKTSTHEWTTDGKFNFEVQYGKNVNLFNSLHNISIADTDNKSNEQVKKLLNYFKIAFKIKFLILDLDKNVTINNIYCDTPNYKNTDDYVTNEINDTDVTEFALIVKFNGDYLVPYNLYFNTLLYSTKQLSTLDIDILIQSFCGKKFSTTKNTTPTIIDLSKNAKNKMISPQVNAISKTGLQVGGEPQPNVSTKVETTSIKNEIIPNPNVPNKLSRDDENIKKAYSKDSKLSYYVVIELSLWPGTSINAAQKLKMECQKNADEVRRAWSEWQGLIYVPTPLFINNRIEEPLVNYNSDVNRALQTKSISIILKENNKYDQLTGDDFIDKMKEKINTTNEFTRAFAILPIASDEYNNLLKSRKVSTEDLNALITEAKYALR